MNGYVIAVVNTLVQAPDQHFFAKGFTTLVRWDKCLNKVGNYEFVENVSRHLHVGNNIYVWLYLFIYLF